MLFDLLSEVIQNHLYFKYLGKSVVKLQYVYLESVDVISEQHVLVEILTADSKQFPERILCKAALLLHGELSLRDLPAVGEGRLG